MVEKMSGAVTYPKGYLAAGARAGLKESGNDLALVASECPAVAAGVFTTNIFQAAPVTVSKSRVPASSVRAVVANSGNANACTGEQGMLDALSMTSAVAQQLGVPADSVLVASTGVIGHAMPMDKINAGIVDAVRSLSVDGGASAARAIMTTDTFPKEAAIDVSIGGCMVRIGGMVKGSGMICPNVATMLAFITTDAAISPEMLQKCLSRSAEISFNGLTVDGDTSTNDSVFVLANGMAGNKRIESDGPELDAFQSALDEVSTSLAKQVAIDGEGATKMVEITVRGTESFEDARQIAKTIANSPLVKTAMFGNDPNWGRVLAAAGRAGVGFDPKSVKLFFGDIALLRHGEPVDFPQDAAHDLLTQPEVKVLLEVGAGSGTATVWTCDFSYDYIKINAEYHT